LGVKGEKVSLRKMGDGQPPNPRKLKSKRDSLKFDGAEPLWQWLFLESPFQYELR